MNYKKLETIENVAAGFGKLLKGDQTYAELNNCISFVLNYSFKQVIELPYTLEVRLAILDFQNEIKSIKNEILYKKIK